MDQPVRTSLKGKKDVLLASLLTATFLLLHFGVYLGLSPFRYVPVTMRILHSWTDSPVVLDELALCEEKRPTYLNPFQKITYSYQVYSESVYTECDIVEQAELFFTSDMKPVQGDPYEYWDGHDVEGFGRPLVANEFPNPIFFLVQYGIIVALLYIFFKPLRSGRSAKTSKRN